jgi:hypothetical protein
MNLETSVIIEPFYGIYGEDNQETRQESQKSSKATDEPRRKKQKQVGSPLPVESTGRNEYSVTPLHQVMVFHYE